MRRVLVTGATGFLGGAALSALEAHDGVEVIAACRAPERLSPSFNGEVRAGDLDDAAYRSDVVAGVDVVCHAATPASMWGHATEERQRFFEPARDLVEQAIGHGAGRFVLAATVALDDGHRRGFWPHLDLLADLDRHLEANSGRGTQMVTLRLGHFVGVGNRIGLVPALLPRLRTHLVPWLAGGRSRLPLIGDEDLGRAMALAATAPDLDDYESLDICGPAFPSVREVIDFVAAETGLPRPHYSVPFKAGYAFGWLMEKVAPARFGSSPFLTRSIVHLCEDRVCSGTEAEKTLGYLPQQDWREAIASQVKELAGQGYPWPRLSQF